MSSLRVCAEERCYKPGSRTIEGRGDRGSMHACRSMNELGSMIELGTHFPGSPVVSRPMLPSLFIATVASLALVTTPVHTALDRVLEASILTYEEWMKLR